MKNIVLIVLDSVRRDIFNLLFKKFFSELKTDFVNFKNCSSIYTSTFLSHYALFFGDYFMEAKNNNFPAQLKNLGFNTRGYFNCNIIVAYPVRDSVESKLSKIRPYRDEIIEDLGCDSVFNWKKKMLGFDLEDYYGTADDELNNIPAKWKDFLKKRRDEKNFIFLHFWKTHHNYDINQILDNKIRGKNYSELGYNLLHRVYKGDIPLKSVKKIYSKRILELVNTYVKELIKVLKDKGIYNDSFIIITSDHGEGLGDIGFSFPNKFYNLYSRILRNYNKIRNKYQILPIVKKWNTKWSIRLFFHGSEHDFQRRVPLLIKFPENKLGGISYYNKVSFFDIIHTINELSNYKLDIKNTNGCSLYYLLTNGEYAREKFKFNLQIKKMRF